MESKNLLITVKNTIKNYHMLDNHHLILVGVSGGPDSMVLLNILTELYPNKVVAAHLNHMFRGEEAERDATFVREQCFELGVPSIIEQVDVPLFMQQTGLGAQEAARQVRYQFYLKTAKSIGATHIALGHHANDQAETILMRLIRGTGTYGLSGIPYIRDYEELKIIRPLLDVTRNEIENYCQQNTILYRIDKSNLSTKYFRNEIRLNVIPYLQDLNINITEHLHQLAKTMQDENTYFTKIAEDFLTKNNIDISKDGFSIDIDKLKNLDLALQRRVIHLILRYLNVHNEITYKHIENIIQLAKHQHPSKSINIPGVTVYRNYGELVFTIKANVKAMPYKHTVQIPGDIVLFGFNKRIKFYISDTYVKPKGIWEAVFDYDKLKEKSLIIRSREAGDKISLLGTNGSKKLKDILIDQKVPRTERDKIPVVENSGNIIWVPGIKKADYALISDLTKNFLYIVVEEL